MPRVENMHIGAAILMAFHVALTLSSCPAPSPCRCYQGYYEGERGEVIDCAYKSLTEIPRFTFNQSKVYLRLNLRRNHLTSLSDTCFQGMKVKAVDLGDNQISSIHPGAFSGLETSLEVLILDKNMLLSDIPKVTFHSMERLGTIDLSSTNLRKAPHAPSLQFLQMDRCALTDEILDGQFFPNYTRLTTLRMQYNRFNRFPTTALSNIKQTLTSVNFQANTIREILDSDLVGFDRLEVFDVNSNRYISRVPIGALTHVPKLRQLNLYNNNISVVEDNAFESVKNLERLDLGINPLYMVPSSSLRPLNNLKYLTLWATRIGNISGDAFRSISSRQMGHIDIGLNGFTSMPAGLLVPVGTLISLHINNNKLSDLPEVFLSPVTHSLQSLRIEKNRFTQIPGSVSRLHQLSSFYAYDNAIETFIGDELSPDKINYVDIRNNRIKDFPARLIYRAKRLSSMDLSDNLINETDACAVVGHPRIYRMYLHRNPMHCGCNMKYIVFNSRVDISSTSSELLCASPESLVGREVKSLQPSEFACNVTFEELCPPHGQSRATSLTLNVVLILISVSTVFI